VAGAEAVQPREGVGQAVDVARRVEEAVHAVFDQLGQAADVGRHDGAADGAGLAHDQGRVLRPGAAYDEGGRPGQCGLNLVGFQEAAEPLARESCHVGGIGRRSVDGQCASGAVRGHRHQVGALVRHEAAHEDELGSTHPPRGAVHPLWEVRHRADARRLGRSRQEDRGRESKLGPPEGTGHGPPPPPHCVGRRPGGAGVSEDSSDRPWQALPRMVQALGPDHAPHLPRESGERVFTAAARRPVVVATRAVVLGRGG